MEERLKAIEAKVDLIADKLIGDLDKPGFIEKTKSDFNKVDYRLNSLEGSRKAGAGALVALIVGWVTKVLIGI